MPRAITAFSNPLVKQARGLRDKKNRRREGLFLAEGLRILTEAREAGVLPQLLFYSDAAHPLLHRLIDETEAQGGEAIETSADILHKISGKENPQTVLGIYRAFDTSLRQIDRNAAPLWIVAQALRDPGNIGTILRTGDAAGAGGLILVDECADPFSVEAVRASMGALFTQRIAAAPWAEFLGWLRDGEGELVGTSLETDIDYQQPTYRKPAFILVGNEQAGLPADYAAACDVVVKIPMLGRADSLNAAVAAAVMAYEVVNQFRRRGL
ncbi:RNA methyltransferase [Sphingosinicella sp. CPCC 101087]|uniref:TrmH family RNA methyltransferase n=1 Tax=Sphingosinicella sp. CPCC 101087 TaxID=2497754 RepID=UPI00101C36DD|nr:RNA methyltransferase [Sphingosinicella sp. CPCC 101087]